MFRAITCPSSGGQIVFTQHLVSSLSVNVCTVNRLRAESALNREQCVNLTTDMHLVPKLRMSGSILSITHVS